MTANRKRVKKRAGKKIHSAVTLHAHEKAQEIRRRYGPNIDYATVLAILDDRKSTRFPVTLRFATEGIEPGMFAKTDPVSAVPDEGYIISVHSHFERRVELLPALILYQLVVVNYGDLATANDAELFGSTILGIDRDDYYAQIVAVVDAIWAD